jgi:hypothetical protein
MLVHLAVTLLLGAAGPQPARTAVAGAAPGLRARDAMELSAAHRRDGAGAELTRHLGRTPQPPRAGTDAAQFLAVSLAELAPLRAAAVPARAVTHDPRSARRPAYYANAPPLRGRYLA